MCLHVCVCMFLWVCTCVCVDVYVCVRVELASPHPCTQCLPILPSNSYDISSRASRITVFCIPMTQYGYTGSELNAPLIPRQS